MRKLIPGLLVGSLWIIVAACTSTSRTLGNGGDAGPDSGSGGANGHAGASAGHAGTGHGGAGNGHDAGVSGNGGTGLDSGSHDSGSNVDSGSNGDSGSNADSGSDAAANPQCVHDIDCDDNDACTDDSCPDGTCSNTAVDIDDNDACTDDACNSNTGVSHTPVDVDDGDGCTTDVCHSNTGAISHDFCSSGLCDTTNTCLTETTENPFNSTPALAISINVPPIVVTDTIDVSGIGTVIRDLNVRTSITHSYCSDLDVTIESPAGTVVTLTTDNADAVADVFNGTTWDDSASPDGTPAVGWASSHNGLVADYPYVTGVVASPLAPEESLGAFIGENPNGTWTITISDDSAGDGGSLDGWGLDFTTISAAPTKTAQAVSQTTPTAIADLAISTSTLDVPAATGTQVCSLTVTTDISHSYSGDLEIALTSPAGTIVTLTSNNGLSNDNVFGGTLWDDTANPGGQVPYDANDGLATDQTYLDQTLASPLVPEEALSAFIGEDPTGTWTLTVADDQAGDTGTLNSWGLNIGRCMRAP